MYWSMTLNLKESSGWHSHEVYELLYCRKGRGHIVFDNQDISFQGGRFILILPENRHRFLFGQDESADLKILCLTAADAAIHLSSSLSNWLLNIKKTPSVFSDHEENSEFSALFDKIPAALGATEKKDLDIIWGRIGLILAIHFRNQGAGDMNSKGRHGDTVDRICNWIDDNLAEQLTLDIIASEFGMSRSLLTREFRKFTSISIVEYMNMRRLQTAGAILSKTGKSITEAALESGFSSIGNFYQKFKALYGVTPSEFKKQLDLQR